MSDIATKLTYLNETKSQLKDMINYGLPTENQITNETTFRNYVKGIFEAFLESLRDSTTLYTNLPKISGNGTQITLNDTANAPMRITLKASELSQDATPTPDSPQDIHTISGDNSVVVEGKNYIDLTKHTNKLASNTTVTSNSITCQCTGSWQGKVISPIELEPNTDYKISCNVDSNASYSIIDYIKGTKNGVSTNIVNSQYFYYFKNGYSFNSGDYDSWEISFYTVGNSHSYIGQTLVLDELMIEKGTTKTSFEPYVSQTAPINLPVENLFDINNEHKVVINPATGTERYGLIVKAPNKKVSISGIWNNDLSLTYRLITNNVASDYTSINSNTTINVIDEIVFYVGSENVKMSSVVSNLQVEISDKPNSYTPYGTTPIEYCKIGNYEDEFVRSDGEQLFDIGTSNSDYAGVNEATPSFLTINGNALTMVIQSGGGTRFYRKQNLVGNDTFTINSTTSVNEARYFVRIRKLDNSGWLTGDDYTFASGWTYNQYFGGWYINIRNGNNALTFDIPNCLYWQIGFGWDTNVYAGTTQIMSNIMLNKGTIALPYEPYGTNQWYLKKNIGKVVLDGTGYWGIASEGDTTNGFSMYTTSVTNIISNMNKPLMSDKFNYISRGSITSSSINFVYSGATNVVVLNIDRTLLNEESIAGFKSWLSTELPYLYYPLSTPTYTQITGTLETQLNNIYKNMLSYKGTTNISQVNNDLPFVLGVSAIQDLE